MESFDLDLELGTLALTFDSPVSNASRDIDWTGVSLRTHSNGLEGYGVGLWNTEEEDSGRGGGAVSSNSGLTITVAMHTLDVDELKASLVGHNSSFAWLELRQGAFESLFEGHPSNPIYGSQVHGHRGMRVSHLVPDTTRSDSLAYCCRWTVRPFTNKPAFNTSRREHSLATGR